MEPVRHFWRVDKELFRTTAKAGEGARLYGGRWNSAGRPAIYCCSTLSACIVEVLVHAVTREERADRRVWYKISLRGANPPTAISHVLAKSLPDGWNDPYGHPATAAIGDVWLRRMRTPVLRAPSAIVPGEFIYVLNPLHPAFRSRLHWSRAAALRLDPRIVERAAGGS